MWSENKKVDICINILIFLIAMNFGRYGQIFVPIICLILFIDNKFKFKVNNLFIFSILVLFAFAFIIFSYKLGVYGIVAVFFPMAYYIGSNIKDFSEKNIIKLIYIIAFGMGTHILLNLVFDFSQYGLKLFRKNNHYDFWTGTIVQQALLSSNCLLIISMLYYVVHYEKRLFYKRLFYSFFLLMVIYNIGLGRRTPVFILFASYGISFVIDKLIFKSSSIRINTKLIFLFFAIIGIFVLTIFFNLFNIKNIITTATIYEKYVNDGLFNSGRLSIWIESIQYCKEYLWGGKLISSVIGEPIHNLWFDVYDYSGIVPFALIVIYTICYISISLKALIKNNLSNGFKILLIGKDIVVCFLMLMEPAITGLSIMIICSIIIETCVSNYLSL